jgi:hypothetical protein
MAVFDLGATGKMFMIQVNISIKKQGLERPRFDQIINKQSLSSAPDGPTGCPVICGVQSAYKTRLIEERVGQKSPVSNLPAVVKASDSALGFRFGLTLLKGSVSWILAAFE